MRTSRYEDTHSKLLMDGDLQSRRLKTVDTLTRKSSYMLLYRQLCSLCLRRLKRVASTLRPVKLCFTWMEMAGETFMPDGQGCPPTRWSGAAVHARLLSRGGDAPGPRSPSPGALLSAATGRGGSCRWPDPSAVLHDPQRPHARPAPLGAPSPRAALALGSARCPRSRGGGGGGGARGPEQPARAPHSVPFASTPGRLPRALPRGGFGRSLGGHCAGAVRAGDRVAGRSSF